MGSCCIILAHARSGSNGLARAVSSATGVPFLLEPFHGGMRRRGIGFSSPEFDAYLDEVMSARIVKHLWNGISLEDNARILSHPGIAATVLLERRDLVSAGLSAAVAAARRVWGTSRRSSVAGPIPLDAVAKYLRVFSKGQRRYQTWLHEAGMPHIALTYEDLYSAEHDDTYRTRILSTVCTYFGLPVVDLERGLRHLHPSKRYNSEERYSAAPNWAEFRARFVDTEVEPTRDRHPVVDAGRHWIRATSTPLTRAAARAWLAATGTAKGSR